MPLPSTTEILRDERYSSNPTTTLAAVELNLRNKGDREYLQDSLLWTRTASERAWKHYSRLGAIHYPLNRAARIAGATTLHAAAVDDTNSVTGPLTRGDTAARAIDIVAGIYSRQGGVRGLIERYFVQQKVCADSHLIRVKESGGYDGYMFVSPDELKTAADGIPGTTNGADGLRWITRPASIGATGRDRAIARQDYLGRVWSPSARYLDIPDSPLYTLDADCDLLHRMNVLLRASYRSRAMTGNILFIPSSLNQLAVGEIVETGSTQLVRRFAEIERKNLEMSEDGDASDVAHIIIAGPDEAGDKIREVLLGDETKETDLKLREELTDRILFALDINTRATTGSGQNHWDAWNDSADELRLAVIPDVEAMCWAFTRLILRPQLLVDGVPPAVVNRTVVAYDLSAASVRINRQEDARQLVDRGGLSLATGRRVAGFEEADAPSEDEYIRQFGYMAKNPFAAFWKLGAVDDPEWDWDLVMQKPGGRPQDSPAEEPGSEPGSKDPGSPDDSDNDQPVPDEAK